MMPTTIIVMMLTWIVAWLASIELIRQISIVTRFFIATFVAAIAGIMTMGLVIMWRFLF